MDKSAEVRNQPVANKSRWFLSPISLGFLGGAAIPVAYGVYVIACEQIYRASHPLGPNEGRCGMGMLLGLTFIFCVGSFCGALGAASVWLAQKDLAS